MKFDFCVGNPPYQEEQGGENKTFSPPVYDKFMDAAYSVADKVELIHPARFLFDSGRTPKAWNEQMLNDPHLKILEYDSDSTKFFSSVAIMGGIAISYHDNKKEFGAIGVFSPYKELRQIISKVTRHSSFESLQSYIWIQTRFNLNALYAEHPEAKSGIGSNGKDSRFEKNIFRKVPIFTDMPGADDDIRALGTDESKKRTWKYISKRFVDMSQENLMSYKLISSVSNGAAGNISDAPVRIIGDTELASPGDGYTRSFIGIGNFELKKDAENCQKYLKTRFARVMIGTMKNTQMLNPDVWRNVPYQDFSDDSDINWESNIREIDNQLYKKYGLSEEEIDFIEKHIKEME